MYLFSSFPDDKTSFTIYFSIYLFPCNSKCLECSDFTTLSCDTGDTKYIHSYTQQTGVAHYVKILATHRTCIVLVYDASESKCQTGLVKNGGNPQTGISSLISGVKRVVRFKQGSYGVHTSFPLTTLRPTYTTEQILCDDCHVSMMLFKVSRATKQVSGLSGSLKILLDVGRAMNNKDWMTPSRSLHPNNIFHDNPISICFRNLKSGGSLNDIYNWKLMAMALMHFPFGMQNYWKVSSPIKKLVAFLRKQSLCDHSLL